MHIPECDGAMQHIGDGVYLGHDGFHLWVACERTPARGEIAFYAARTVSFFTIPKGSSLPGRLSAVGAAGPTSSQRWEEAG
jgi:hypothetical protein